MVELMRILIVDDHPVFRDGVRNMLNQHVDIEVVGEADNGKQALQLAKELKPDLVVMDITMPELSGIEATKAIKAELPETAVLLLSGYSHDSYILAALRAGAVGFLSKGARNEELLNAIRAIARGEAVMDPSLAYKIVSDLAAGSDSDTDTKLEAPHERELEVLKLAAKGMSNKAIAQELILSDRTIQTHLANLFRKFNVNSRTEAVLRALKQGWLSPEDLP